MSAFGFRELDGRLPSLDLLCILGDAAIGKGVNRYLFSSVMHKVKNGFQLDLGLY